MNIYLASSWKNTEYEKVREQLINAGHSVYDFKNEESAFHWSWIDKNYENWNTQEFHKMLNHEYASRAFFSDLTAMDNAECCVLLLPCGKSAHLEAGYFVGKQIPVIAIMTPADGLELTYKMFNHITDNVFGAIEYIAELEKH